MAGCVIEEYRDADDDDEGGGGFFAGNVGAGDVGAGGAGAGNVGAGGVGSSGVGASGAGGSSSTSSSTGSSTSSGTGGTGGTGGTVDPGPCGGDPDQSQDAADGWAFTDIRPLAQSFIAGAPTLSEVSLYIHTSQQLDTFTVYVLGDIGGNPDVNNVIGAADVQNSAVGVEEWLCADIVDVAVNPGSRYWILLNEGSSPIRKNWHESNEGGDPYPGGSKKVTNDGGASWVSYPGEDFTFRTYP